MNSLAQADLIEVAKTTEETLRKRQDPSSGEWLGGLCAVLAGAALQTRHFCPPPPQALSPAELHTMKRLATFLLGILLACTSSATKAETVRIVGIGAASCTQFNQEIAQKPAVERDYLAWAQGFMSGALMRAPQGVDETLDLLPPSFPLQQQADFLRAFCAQNPNEAYMDAVHTLYQRLKAPAT